MGTEESNSFDTRYRLLMPQDDAFDNSGSTSSSFLKPHAASSYFSNYALPKQGNGTPLQYGFMHDVMTLSNNPIEVSRDTALVFPEKLRGTFDENNVDSMKFFAGNLRPDTLKYKESRNKCNRSSIPKNDNEGMSLSGTSGSKESPGEGHGTNIDFPLTVKQQYTVMLGNANSSEQNQNSGTCLNTTNSSVQFSKLGEDEIRKERKRQSNRESAKRSRMRKQKECEELHRNMDILKDENSELTHLLMKLSEECLELSTENDSIEEELVEMYGPESIADLLPMKPASVGSQTTVKEES
ncbi:PREDICTED: transcription factor HBP-1a-like isoform X2 [Lupinus angustifolius]|uniref:transcription factor HBP-1a-like isoform X2 n=1 Tax=Lupinus angustifolius TaxID=3871 RepID=UPI00092F2C6F|nr:PREDICTED: transcription factor HBP-1a-like isoform X2 [Lupinus angustifolius]XP_019454894.1 PREDICTED: transcription factor HBP-1a-like isoform X2 [Lupinus angustifolius]